MMGLDTFSTAISPIDGRYRGKTEPLADYYSEFALIRYRVRVEIEILYHFRGAPSCRSSYFDARPSSIIEKDIYRDFTEEDAARVKDIEKVTNHDVKAVEYFIKEQFDAIGGLDAYKEFIHFAPAGHQQHRRALVHQGSLWNRISGRGAAGSFQAYAEEWKDVPMLAKTLASPPRRRAWARKSRSMSIACASSSTPSRPASSRQSLVAPRTRSTPTTSPTPSTTGAPSPGTASRETRTGARAMDHADQQLRPPGQHLRRHPPHQHHHDRSRPRRLDVYLDGVFPPEDQEG